MSVSIYEQSGGSTVDQLPIASTPDQLMGWLAPEVDGTDARLFSPLGDRLPPVVFSAYALEWFRVQADAEETPIMQKQMLETTIVSPVTGCWLPSDSRRYRAVGGYIPCGDIASGVTESGSTVRHRAVVNRYDMINGHGPLNPGIHIDHICRNTACCFPYHLRRVTPQQNNYLRDQAHDFEVQLSSKNSTMTPTGIPWLDELLEKTTQGIVATISTRYGAFLLKLDIYDALVPVYNPCEIREALRLPPRHRPRADRLQVAEGQLSLGGNDSIYDALLAQVVVLPRPNLVI